jgi:hypothetical protein
MLAAAAFFFLGMPPDNTRPNVRERGAATSQTVPV